MAHFVRRIDHDSVVNDFLSAKFTTNELAEKYKTAQATICGIITQYFKEKEQKREKSARKAINTG